MGIRIWSGIVMTVALVSAVPQVGIARLPFSQAGSAQANRDAQEIKNYRLSMDVIKKLGNVYKALFVVMSNDPTYQLITKAKAELKAIENKEEPTEAEQKRAETLSEEIDRLEDQAGGALNMNESQSLSDMAQSIEKTPPMAAAVRQGGMTPREFATAQLALFQSMFAYGFLKSGTIKELPKEISAENVKFLQDHEGEIQALTAEWEKFGKERK